MKELWAKIQEALYSALPITAIVYILTLTPLVDLSSVELITFTIGAVLLIVGIGLFSLGADLAMTPMGSHVGSGLSKQRKLGLLLALLSLPLPQVLLCRILRRTHHRMRTLRPGLLLSRHLPL